MILVCCRVSTERHKAEVRRCVNDEKLSTVAYQYVPHLFIRSSVGYAVHVKISFMSNIVHAVGLA